MLNHPFVLFLQCFQKPPFKSWLYSRIASGDNSNGVLSILTPVKFHEVFKMAADRGEREARKSKRSESSVENHVESDDEYEPDFSDPEDFIEDISDEGERSFIV